MDSMHDVNIACEVEVLLGIELPSDQTMLYEENRALSIRQSAERIFNFIEASQ